LFVNGLPVATFELKNNFTCQNVRHAIEQYKTDRDTRETLFAFARCLVHFAVDEQEVQFCTQLQGKASELPIVAFSGEHDFGASPVSEASLNGFPSSDITSRIQELIDLDSYRIDKQHQRRLPLPDTAAIELQAALNRAIDPLFLDQSEFYKQFKDNPQFRNFVQALVERLINNNPGEST
jgi:hypothetical protein